MQVRFSAERDGETQNMKHYFFWGGKKNQHIYSTGIMKIGEKFEEFIEAAKGEIENWSVRGTGWVLESIEIAYVNVTRYEPIKGGTYLPTPAKLANKKAIINVKNKDNECLRWALRAALFPAPRGKNPNRQSSYPVNDGINYE